MQNVNEIDELIKIISKLPGLGPKSAKRIVLKLINNKDELVKPIANVLVQIYKNVIEKFPDADLIDVNPKEEND